MPNSVRQPSAGFTFVEVMITVVLLGLAAASAGVPVYGYLRKRADYNAVVREQSSLNRALDAYVVSGGTVDGTDTAVSVLLKLQTPLTATSAMATGGMHTLVPLNHDLNAYSANDGMARLYWDAVALRYKVATTGAGYRPVRLATPKSLTAVTRTLAGQNFGTTSKWVWEYAEASATGSGTAATLAWSGPTTITTPGTYTWTLTSNVSGTLSVTLPNSSPFTATGTTASQSATFAYGDVKSFTITGALSTTDPTQAQTAFLPVSVNIPLSSLSVTYGREDTSTSTSFTYAQVSNPSGAPAVRNGIVLSVVGNPTGVSIYYTYDGKDPSQSSNLYSGPFHVPLSAWSNGVPLKAVAISTSNGAYKTGPVLTMTLVPVATQLSMPTFSVPNGATVMEGSTVSVIPSNTTTDSPRTAVGTLPTVYSSTSLNWTMQ